MNRTIETIDIYNYSVPDKQGRVKKEGTKQAKVIFDLLSQHLKDNDMYPDEYFIDSSDNYAVNNGNVFESDFYCHTNFGGSEGVYIDIYQRDQNGKRVNFATAKTLDEGGDAFIKMSRIAAECSLMLNGYGNKYSLSEKDSNIKEYFLSDKETTPYIILEQNKDIALLRRFTPDPKNDPTPYIVVSGLNLKDNNLIEWDSGYYCNSIIDASLIFADFTNKKINTKQELTDEQSYDVQRILENAISCIPNNESNKLTITELEGLTTEILDNNLYQHEVKNQDAKELFVEPLTIDSENIEVDNHLGTWYVIDGLELEENSTKLFLLEHEEYGDEAANVIVDETNKLIMDDVYNGFDDYFEAFGEHLRKNAKFITSDKIIYPQQNRGR